MRILGTNLNNNSQIKYYGNHASEPTMFLTEKCYIGSQIVELSHNYYFEMEWIWERIDWRGKVYIKDIDNDQTYSFMKTDFEKLLLGIQRGYVKLTDHHTFKCHFTLRKMGKSYGLSLVEQLPDNLSQSTHEINSEENDHAAE